MMRKWGFNGIRHQVLLLALVPTLTVSIFLVAYFTSTRIQDLEQTFQERGEAIALKLAPAGEYGVFSRNKAILQNLCQATLTEHDVQSVAFYTENGQEIASSGKTVFPFKLPSSHSLNTNIFVENYEQIMSLIVPITTRNEVSHIETLTGWLKIELDSTSIHRREYQILIDTGMILLLGLAISGLHALQMGRNVTRPILELAFAVERIKKGDLDIRIRPTAYHEMQILEAGINTMAQTLQNSHNELQNKIAKATANLRCSLETIEVQNLELDLARQTAETTSKIKSEFLADMSHEIRTPLNAVVGFINLLKKTELNPKQQDYINTISKSSQSLLSIINDILDLSKIEAGKLCIERTRMNIRDCLEETLSLLSPHANEKGLAVIPLIYSDVPTECLGDPLRIKQVITNLVSNALKFTEQGSIIVRVMLEQGFNNGHLIKISVTDTGIGLSDEEQQALFQAFTQAKVETSRQFGGTGLGLVICKKLVEHMGGTIGLTSVPNKGSTFWFTFAIEKALPIQNKDLMTYHKKQFSINHIHILAVDDNPENLKLITVLLEELGIIVSAVSSGEEALKAISHNQYDLILMDIRMPKMNGIETTHAIRALEIKENRQHVPIIALTAHALISEKEALLNSGVDDYLMKPIFEPELQAIIFKWGKSREPITVDWILAKKLAGGKQDLAEELFQKLIETLPKEQENINQAFNEKKLHIMRELVHRVHGASCYCGVPNLKNSTQKLESALATETLDIIKPRLEAFNKAVDHILAYAERHLILNS